jgi:hypothetical protein
VLIKADADNIELYLEKVKNKCSSTFIEGLVNDVYRNHKSILRLIINNLDILIPDHYIGNSIDLTISGFNIDQNKLVKKIQNSKQRLKQYFILHRDYIRFIRKKLCHYCDYQIVNLISDFYYNTSSYSRYKINKFLLKKYYKLRNSLDYESNSLINMLIENKLYKLNRKLSLL